MTALPIIIAIPARNEADRIGACLSAIAAQPNAHGHIAGVIVYANNCTDDTAAVAASATGEMPFPLQVIAADLPPERSHIGHARREAIDCAFDCLMAAGLGDAIIAGTDADSKVAPGWLAALIAAFDADIDAVCGAIDLEEPVPPALAALRAAEMAYAEATARVVVHHDPMLHDPWPNHMWCWGANLSVRARALADIGGSPLVDLAEDRALHAALLRGDKKIRHSGEARVITSARSDGRAPGGFADLMASYTADPAALADFWLEPAALTWERARQRGDARREWGHRRGFGAHWADHESATPALAAQRVAVADLPAETAALKRLLDA